MHKMLRLAALSAALLTTAAVARAQTIIGITNDDEVFTVANAAAPTVTSTPVAITGLASGMSVAGADYRPNTGQLFILGYDESTQMARLYTLNPATGAATAIGTAAIMLPLGSGSVGFDFNPTVDRIRVVAANGANYRLNPITGGIAATDGNLAYVSGDANFGVAPAIGAAAYTNSYIGSEATTLYDYDEGLDIIVRQNPPNNGGLETIGSSTITTNDIESSVDMDIYTNPVTGSNTAYLAANPGITTADALYTVNLSNGSATLVGFIGVNLAVKDIAVVIDRTVPAATGDLIYGLTRVNRNLIQFDSDNPAIVRWLKPVTGLMGGQRLVGMDVRPADLNLYALGYNDTFQSFGLYRIDTTSGAATMIGAIDTLSIGASGAGVGFDFNPTVDRIRVVSASDSNYRLNPATGAIAAYDMPLMYATGDVATGVNPMITSVAYTNSFSGATTTALYGIDDSLRSFVKVPSPNTGSVVTIMQSAFPISTTDRTFDLDVYYDSTSMSNRIWMVANGTSGANDSLYLVDTMGNAMPMGRVGTGTQLMDIAVRLTFRNSAGTGIGTARAGANGVEVYPNPAGAELNIRLREGNRMQVTLADMAGATVRQSAGGQALSLDLRGLAPGIYFARVTVDGAQTAVIKVSKQ